MQKLCIQKLNVTKRIINTYAPDTYNWIFNAAPLIRCDSLNKNRWKFTGSYDNDEIPTSLEQLLMWIIIGLKDTVDLTLKSKKCDVTI